MTGVGRVGRDGGAALDRVDKGAALDRVDEARVSQPHYPYLPYFPYKFHLNQRTISR